MFAFLGHVVRLELFGNAASSSPHQNKHGVLIRKMTVAFNWPFVAVVVVVVAVWTVVCPEEVAGDEGVGSTKLHQTAIDRKEKAVIDVVVLKRRNGTLSPSDNIQLNGIFSTAGAVDYAKGYLRQVSFVLNHIES